MSRRWFLRSRHPFKAFKTLKAGSGMPSVSQEVLFPIQVAADSASSGALFVHVCAWNALSFGCTRHKMLRTHTGDGRVHEMI